MKVKIILFLLVGIIGSSQIQAQELTKEQKKQARKEKKANRKAEQKAYEEQLYRYAVKAIEDREFILTAHTLYSKRGHAIQVSDHLNFISVEGKDVVLQLAFNGHTGRNGVGGITLTGKISSFEEKKDKHGNHLIHMYVSGSIFNADVDLILYKNNNRADATVNASTRSSKIKFSGELHQPELSNHYQSGLTY